MIKPYIQSPKYTDEQWMNLIKIRPQTILSQNSKLKKDGIWNVTIPAIQARICSGNKLINFNTCQAAGICKSFCYASQGSYIFSASMVHHHRILQWMLDNPREFINKLIQEIKSKKKCKIIRWNDSGDFFQLYWNIAVTVMNHFPNIKFYCYTKNVPLFRKLEADGCIPGNFTYVFSVGGKFDKEITENDRIAIPFRTRKELRGNKCVEAYNSDKPASNPKNKRIGLIMHSTPAYMKQITAGINLLHSNLE